MTAMNEGSEPSVRKGRPAGYQEVDRNTDYDPLARAVLQFEYRLNILLLVADFLRLGLW